MHAFDSRPLDLRKSKETRNYRNTGFTKRRLVRRCSTIVGRKKKKKGTSDRLLVIYRLKKPFGETSKLLRGRVALVLQTPVLVA